MLFMTKSQFVRYYMSTANLAVEADCLVVVVGSTNPVKVNCASIAFQQAFPDQKFVFKGQSRIRDHERSKPHDCVPCMYDVSQFCWNQEMLAYESLRL